MPSTEVPDVVALLPRVQSLGGSAPGPADDMPWGQRVAHVTDPDRHAVNHTQQRRRGFVAANRRVADDA